MINAIVAFVSGLIFAVGLALAGMTNPTKVVGFLNPFAWDPSLAFVMVGAIGVHLVAYRLLTRRRTPLCAGQWHVPTRRDVDKRLVAGSLVFGLGWGLVGICPGPGIVSLVAGATPIFVFVGAMVAGMALFSAVEAMRNSRRAVHAELDVTTPVDSAAG